LPNLFCVMPDVLERSESMWTLVDHMLPIFNPLIENAYCWHQQCILQLGV
jgi:hypothetical protein